MSKKTVHGICQLCQQDTELVNSHIIPKLHWKRLKKADGYFYILPNKPEKQERREQREVTERILCASCDNDRLGKRYEDYIARVLFGGMTLESKNEGRFLKIKGFDYTRLKNGLLSILWRMSVSSNDLFKEVSLGHKHSERIRNIILNEETVDNLEYPIVCCAPKLDGQFLKDWILTPNCCRAHGNRVYNCLISGLIFTFIVGSAELDRKTKKFILKQESPLSILKADESEIPFLHEFLVSASKAQIVRNRKINSVMSGSNVVPQGR